MTSISWNEVRDRALRFSREWAGATDEERDKQTFWNEFFEVFGIPRKSVATFEKAVAKAEGGYGFVDLFWRGVLLVEHKSAGRNLSKAESQAFDYIAELTHRGLHEEVPRYVILSDFRTFVLFDLEPDKSDDLPPDDEGRRIRVVRFPLTDLSKMVRELAFIKGEQPVRLDPDDPANLKATQLLADLHDALASSGFNGHSLERQLERYRDRVPRLDLMIDEHHHRVIEDHRTAVLAVPNAQPDWLMVLSESEDEIQRLTLEFSQESEDAPANTPQHELDLFDELVQMYLREYRRYFIITRLIEHGTEYSLDLILSNNGHVSATDVRVDIDFPESCLVVEDDDRDTYGKAPKPIRPRASWLRRREPRQLSTMASVYTPAMIAYTPATIAPVPYRPPDPYRGPLYSIDEDGTYIGVCVPRKTYNDVQFEADKLRHGEPWKLPRLILFLAPTEASALHASVTLHCDEYPAPDEQKLVFVLGEVE